MEEVCKIYADGNEARLHQEGPGAKYHVDCSILTNIEEIAHAVEHESGIFIFPFQYPLDAWYFVFPEIHPGEFREEGLKYINDYSRIRDIVYREDFRLRSRAVCICGYPMDKMARGYIKEPYPIYEWYEKSVSLWIPRPRDKWDLRMAINYIFVRDMLPL